MDKINQNRIIRRQERIELAKNLNASKDSLSELAKDDWWVKIEVARNKNIPINLQTELSKDPDIEIRKAVFLNDMVDDKIKLAIYNGENDNFKKAFYSHLSEKNKSVVSL